MHSESFTAGLIYSEQLVDRVADVYKKRKSNMPRPPCTDEITETDETEGVYETSETSYDNIREIAAKM